VAEQDLKGVVVIMAARCSNRIMSRAPGRVSVCRKRSAIVQSESHTNAKARFGTLSSSDGPWKHDGRMSPSRPVSDIAAP
jgi:hypothetical protein